MPAARAPLSGIAGKFEILSRPGDIEQKMVVATGIRDHVDRLVMPRGRCLEPDAVHRCTRRASAGISWMLKHGDDGHAGDTIGSLQLFVCACQSLFAQVPDVRNFDRVVAHGLFSLVESSVAVHALHELAAARQGLGSPGDIELDSLAKFSGHPQFEAEVLSAAGIVLALAQAPVARLEEIAGFGYAFTWAAAALSRGRPGRSRYLGAWRTLRHLLAYDELNDDNSRRRIVDGVQIFELCVDLLAESAKDTPARIRRGAIRIFEHKARYAMLHHKSQRLGGRRLVEWFSDKPFRAEAMLQALYRSPWIDPHDIDASRFFQCLAGPGGGMDGVFSAAEMDVLKRYYTRYRGVPADGLEPRALSSSQSRLADTRVADVSPPHDHKRRFLCLLRAEAEPRAVGVARAVITEVLAEAHSARRAGSTPPVFEPFAYESRSVVERVSQIYWFQSEQAQRVDLELDDAALKTFHLYFAPLALIDGCWLRRAVAHKNDGKVEMALYGIYADEIGNGDHDCNHANIYGRLMGELGWNISSVNDESLVTRDDLPALAFKVPCFLLALDLASQDHFPELLGATLAIEMSGLDGLYEKMIENLERHGYSAAFWRLHVSVDNYSSGHARQALQAIIDYMEQTRSNYGASLAATVWERVWAGFLTMLYLFEIELRVLMGAILVPGGGGRG
ncbi:MAG: iron-containing redox enzyme family protein [Gammaproteobacteria bacterium]